MSEAARGEGNVERHGGTIYGETGMVVVEERQQQQPAEREKHERGEREGPTRYSSYCSSRGCGEKHSRAEGSYEGDRGMASTAVLDAVALGGFSCSFRAALSLQQSRPRSYALEARTSKACLQGSGEIPYS